MLAEYVKPCDAQKVVMESMGFLHVMTDRSGGFDKDEVA